MLLRQLQQHWVKQSSCLRRFLIETPWRNLLLLWIHLVEDLKIGLDMVSKVAIHALANKVVEKNLHTLQATSFH